MNLPNTSTGTDLQVLSEEKRQRQMRQANATAAVAEYHRQAEIYMSAGVKLDPLYKNSVRDYYLECDQGTFGEDEFTLVIPTLGIQALARICENLGLKTPFVMAERDGIPPCLPIFDSKTPFICTSSRIFVSSDAGINVEKMKKNVRAASLHFATVMQAMCYYFAHPKQFEGKTMTRIYAPGSPAKRMQMEIKELSCPGFVLNNPGDDVLTNPLWDCLVFGSAFDLYTGNPLL